MPKLPKASLLNLNFLDGMLIGIDKVSDCINSIESLMILISSVSINIANRCLAGCQVAISRAILHFIPHDFLTMTPITISMHATREQPHPIPSPVPSLQRWHTITSSVSVVTKSNAKARQQQKPHGKTIIILRAILHSVPERMQS